MLKRIPNRRVLIGGFGLLAVIALNVPAAISYVSANRWVDHTLEVQQRVDEWTIALLEAERWARGYAVSDNPAFLASYEAALDGERANAAAAARLVADNPGQTELVQAADRHAHDVVALLRDLVTLGRHRGAAEAHAVVASVSTQPRMDLFRADARALRAEEGRLLDDRRSRATVQGLLLLGGGLLLAATSIALFSLGWRAERRRVELLNAVAGDARRRLGALSSIASALAEARTPTQVADVVIAEGKRIAGADTCTLYLLDEAGTGLDLMGESGTAKEVIDKIRRITADSGNPATFQSMRSGTPTFAENEAEYEAIFPALATMKATGRRAKAFWSMPLIVEGRAVGLLGMGFYEARSFPAEERTLIETLARQCGQALVRASKAEREDEARRWFATTLASIGDAVIATDHEGRVTFMNPIAERLTGWITDDARRRPLDDVFHIISERTRAPVESPVARVLREGRIVGLANHTVLRSKHGVEVPIDDSAAPIRDDSGRVFGVVMVFRDVTEAKRQEARREFLARSGHELASSLDYRTTLATVARFAVPQLADWCSIDVMESEGAVPRQLAVAHVDPGKMQYARDLGERYPPDPGALTGAPAVMRSGKSELYAEIPEALLEAGARDAEHLRIIRELQLHSAMIVPLRGRARIFGAMTFVYAESARHYTDDDLAFAEDFGQRAAMAIENAMAMKEIEAARAREHQLRQDAELANRAKDDFLATVSHELRNPLNAILGWTITLRGRKPGEHIDHPLGIIERNARAQAKLIEDVLDISRIISGKLALNLGPVDVAEVVATAVETVTLAATAKSITLTADVEQPTMMVTADVDRLQQILWNLLMNAVKFTPRGGHVTLRAFQEGSEIRIRITDDGEGIRPEVLPHVFERFQQADGSTTRRHGGLGLGLAIVRHLVTAHGGTVSATSEGVGEGATFVISLPARSAIPAVTSSLASFEAQPQVRLEGLRVLVVDDEDDARMLVSTVLGDLGAEVHLAGSAAEALTKIIVVLPDVVVSDIGMPHMDGYALIRKIRALSPAVGGRTPAVALTAFAREEDAQRAFAAGFQRHVAKPIEPMQLAGVVANLGGRSQEPAP